MTCFKQKNEQRKQNSGRKIKENGKKGMTYKWRTPDYKKQRSEKYPK